MGPFIAAVLALLAGVQPGSVTHRGIAKYYSPGMFRIVAENRGMELRGDVDGYASTPDCSNIGRVILARVAGGRWERYQVLDCSAPRDRERHLDEGLILEIDYASAARAGFIDEPSAPAIAIYPAWKGR